MPKLRSHVILQHDIEKGENILDERIELVIFDMDGLMVDTESVMKKSWAYAIGQLTGLDFPDALFSKVVGRDAHADRYYFTRHYGDSLDFDAAEKMALDYKSNHIKTHGLVMKKGLLHILDTLDALKSRKRALHACLTDESPRNCEAVSYGIKKCVATSSIWSSMEEKLGSLNLLNRFDGFVTGDQVTKGKPNPEIFLKASKMMDVPPAHCIVLEDSQAGVAAAYSAGMRAIMIPDMAQPDAKTLTKMYAKCEDLIEAAEIIKKLIKNS